MFMDKLFSKYKIMYVFFFVFLRSVDTFCAPAHLSVSDLSCPHHPLVQLTDQTLYTLKHWCSAGIQDESKLHQQCWTHFIFTLYSNVCARHLLSFSLCLFYDDFFDPVLANLSLFSRVSSSSSRHCCGTGARWQRHITANHTGNVSIYTWTKTFRCKPDFIQL